MVRVISIRRTTPAGCKLSKLFSIEDFLVAKDSGKVLIKIYVVFKIIIYFFVLKIPQLFVWYFVA